jgi:hypothetical protein
VDDVQTIDVSSVPNLSAVTAATLTVHYSQSGFQNPQLVSSFYSNVSVISQDASGVIYSATLNQKYNDLLASMSLQVGELTSLTPLNITYGPPTVGGPTTPNYDTILGPSSYFINEPQPDGTFIVHEGNRYQEHIGYSGTFDVTTTIDPAGLALIKTLGGTEYETSTSFPSWQYAGATLTLTVPEPPSLALVAATPAGMFVLARRQKRILVNRG